MPALINGFIINHCAVFKYIQRANVDGNDLLGEDVVEASLRNTPLQRHLAAFEAGTHPSARSGLLALVALAGSFALA